MELHYDLALEFLASSPGCAIPNFKVHQDFSALNPELCFIVPSPKDFLVCSQYYLHTILYLYLSNISLSKHLLHIIGKIKFKPGMIKFSHSLEAGVDLIGQAVCHHCQAFTWLWSAFEGLGCISNRCGSKITVSYALPFQDPYATHTHDPRANPCMIQINELRDMVHKERNLVGSVSKTYYLWSIWF